ncbi:hypothetical protein CMUST_15550 (plasmid) [Corynebacterium mustelae]|uniref:DUF8175 domain-containing protein n=1 Tax=Corynebacterium mustelae TaxID=571915 RepID=A0A0G3H1V9_9CORY|nr:hypothetical protein [Corynebacterium mustelae]AKK07399.1 hypothetical protein CMUST_15550 [Corynebacterium mustelae]
MKVKKTPIVVVGIVAVIAVIAVFAFMLGRGTSVDDHVASSPAVPSETTTNAPEADVKVEQTYETDIWGRQVLINGVTGKVLGNLVPEDNRCEINPKISIQKSYNAQTIWSENNGPSAINSGVPVKYANTVTGAALAGWNYRILLFIGDEITPEVAKHVNFNNQPDLAKKMGQKGLERSEIFTATLAPEAVRVLTCKEDFVVIEMAHKAFGDRNGKFESPQWDIMRFSMTWNGDDWVYDVDSLKINSEIIHDLEGWTKWQY